MLTFTCYKAINGIWKTMSILEVNFKVLEEHRGQIWLVIKHNWGIMLINILNKFGILESGQHLWTLPAACSPTAFPQDITLRWAQTALNSKIAPTYYWRQAKPPSQHNRFTALFPGPTGWADARTELLDFMVQGKINRGRYTDHRAGHHSIRTNQCPAGGRQWHYYCYSINCHSQATGHAI